MIFANIEIDLDTAAVITALAPIITIIITYMLNNKRRAAADIVKNNKLDANAEKIDEVRVHVNGKLTEALARLEDLYKAILEKDNLDVPKNKPGEVDGTEHS